MYPLTVPALTLNDVVGHWLRCRSDRVSFQDLCSELVACFWRDELPLRAPAKALAWDRSELLVLILEGTPVDHGGMVFVKTCEELTKEQSLPDGGLTVYLRPRIFLPKDPTLWTADVLAAAYRVLATCNPWDYPPLVWPGLLAMLVRRSDLGALCDARGWPRPGFWFRTARPSQGVRAKNNAVVLCRHWLAAEAAKAEAKRTKDDYRRQALQRFSGLTSGAFDEVWAATVPSGWRAGGRPRGSKRPR